jgi:hypothetical protein
MRLKFVALASVATLTVGARAGAADLPAATPTQTTAVPFFLFSDTQLQYWDEFTPTDPSVGRTNKQVLTIQHADAWAYGTNFVHLSWLYSDKRDPAECDGFANPTQPSCVNTQGMMEFYGLYRGTWGLNEVTHSKSFAIPGFIKDVALSFGADWETENQNFAAEKKDVVGGLQFQFDLPQGFANISIHAYQEWNHNALPGTINSNVTFNTVPEFEFAYTVPVPGTKELLYIGGFTNYVLPKGPDGFGNQTKAEFLSDNRLTLDIGKLFLDKPHVYDAFIGYRYWLNKYGNNDDVATNGNLQGMKEETWYAGVAWHALSDAPSVTSSAMPVKAQPNTLQRFFLFSDTQLQYWDEFTATDPGVGRTNKQVLTIQHADAWAYGTNFVHLSWLYSDSRDPAQCDAFANPTQPSCVNTEGMMEFYGLYRGTWVLTR